MEEKIFLARVAEQAERFEDMVDFLNEAIDAKSGEDFTIDERNLLSVGFKNLIGSQRGAIRTIGAIEQNPKYQKFGDALGKYKKKIEGELYDKFFVAFIFQFKPGILALNQVVSLEASTWTQN